VGFRFFSTLLNLVTLISVILLCAMIIEWLLAGFERMQRDVFGLVFCVVAVLFTSKYYYGPDITTYVMLYDVIGDFHQFITGKGITSYELGYVGFCSLCHTFGLSYWGMTAVISIMIFAALYLLIKRLRYGRVMALALIIIMNPDLIYAQFRQCISVSLFIFAVLLADRRKYIVALLLAVLAMTMHKSAEFMIVPAILYYMVQPRKMEMSSLGTMLLVLCLLVLIPTEGIVESLIEYMNLPRSSEKSLRMHVSFSNLRQSNLFIYGAALVSLMTFSAGKRGKSAMLVAAMMALIVSVVFYQYYLMVPRLRAYFLPFAVVAIIEAGIEVKEENIPWSTLVRQTSKVIVLGFLIYKTAAFNINSSKDGDVLKMSTVFELTCNTKEELQERQMERAEQFWDEAFLNGEDAEYRNNTYVDQYRSKKGFSSRREEKEYMLRQKAKHSKKKYNDGTTIK